MDPHFNEYLAAIAGMHDTYGGHADDQRTEFHDVQDDHDARPRECRHPVCTLSTGSHDRVL